MNKIGIVIMIKIEIGGIDIGRLRLQGKKIGIDQPVLVQRGKQSFWFGGVIMKHLS